ncbi:hypothetical protein D3C85_1518640 [compost metagenome]
MLAIDFEQRRAAIHFCGRCLAHGDEAGAGAFHCAQSLQVRPMDARCQHRACRCFAHAVAHGVAQCFKPRTFDGHQNRRFETGLPDIDQHALNKAIANLRAPFGECPGQDEGRVGAGHFGENRNRIGT